ncbi:MAG: WecB/TagA/CpsF family glycosyltransferase [Sandaracinus sp.]|nr:WecB/TagA/CpsF family glycosyltransferase [Sandaracinus sp.]MCB9613913.1 WecB/TagA/CpsF family glycosyltransferase [Sandaracinus sp.]MCB9625331.1 WecB/TagA/CpsF family glycosyltransferase [Sandaracinus sp.]MCB9634149.1 WecB/TagA/CpsF family glycosyltransferase [Sandaracinus sp.]
MDRFERIELLGMSIAVCDSSQLLDHMFQSLDAGRGGWVVTANLDILRRAVLEADSRALYGAADLRVADGMPLVWASKLLGAPLPERIAGSTFTSEVAELAARRDRSLYLLGGADGAAEGAREVLQKRYPGLRILGTSSPRVSNPATDAEIDAIVAEIPTAPDILLVGFGSPKQEHVIRKLRERFPRAWMIGIGITFGFLAGQVERAPVWMQRSGTEWIHRMAQEPDRLVRRYLIDDLPFAALLFADALRSRALEVVRRRAGL